jgi:hypothetical protein
MDDLIDWINEIGRFLCVNYVEKGGMCELNVFREMNV